MFPSLCRSTVDNLWSLGRASVASLLCSAKATDKFDWMVDNNMVALIDYHAGTIGGEWMKLSSWWSRR
jgi:hypothetical protein